MLGHFNWMTNTEEKKKRGRRRRWRMVMGRERAALLKYGHVFEIDRK